MSMIFEVIASTPAKQTHEFYSLNASCEHMMQLIRIDALRQWKAHQGAVVARGPARSAIKLRSSAVISRAVAAGCFCGRLGGRCHTARAS